MNRRTFIDNLLVSVGGYALFHTLFKTNALSAPIKDLLNHWILELNEYCQDLHKSTISPTEWQFKMGELYKQVELTDVLKFIDFEKLIKGFDLPDLGVNTKKVIFPTLSGLPENTVFVKKIFGMKKDRAIIPHGHINMASSHLILQGELHLRQYEKVNHDDHHLYVKPTVDEIVKPGTSSSISDELNNVHWFISNTESAYTFDVIMLNIKEKPYDIYNIDIYKKQALGDGSLRVPMIDVDSALKKYGKNHH